MGFGVFLVRLPRVAAARQPWAKSRNAVGVFNAVGGELLYRSRCSYLCRDVAVFAAMLLRLPGCCCLCRDVPVFAAMFLPLHGSGPPAPFLVCRGTDWGCPFVGARGSDPVGTSRCVLYESRKITARVVRSISRAYGTSKPKLPLLPRIEMPGYCHVVPTGRPPLPRK